MDKMRLRKERMKQKKETKRDVSKCLYPGCPGKPVSRGLCRACYGLAHRAVSQGRTTWTELEDAGKATDSVRLTGKTAWFTGA